MDGYLKIHMHVLLIFIFRKNLIRGILDILWLASSLYDIYDQNRLQYNPCIEILRSRLNKYQSISHKHIDFPQDQYYRRRKRVLNISTADAKIDFFLTTSEIILLKQKNEECL